MRILKIIAIVFMIIVSTAGGAVVRLLEVINQPVSLPLPGGKNVSRAISSDEAGVKNNDQEITSLAVNVDPSKNNNVRNTVNVLIVGLDNVEGGSRTDAIALAIFDADKMALRVASIPRDSRVYIPKKGWDKINHAYVYGGIKLLRETLVNLTGMPIDYFVKVNYRSFPKIIDLIGGVDIYVEKRLNYTDYSGKLFINIPQGQQHMNGKTALGYVRFRHDPKGDIGRVERQQKFMNVVMKKLKSPSIIPRIPALVNELMNAVDTDLAPLEALKLMQFANSLPSNRIQMFMAPGKSGYSKNVSYWILDNNAFSQQLAAIAPPSSENLLNSGNINISDKPNFTIAGMSSEKIAELRDQIMSIRILNGDGEKGIGKRAAQIFQRIGIEVPYTGNARHYDYIATSIIYPPDEGEYSRQGAMALAELCGITNRSLIKEDRRAVSISLILGHDKKQIFERLNKLNF